MKSFILLVLFVPQMAFATAMAPAKAKCYPFEELARRHAAWKKDYQRFILEKSTVSPQGQLHLLRNSLGILLKEISDLRVAEHSGYIKTEAGDAGIQLYGKLSRNELTDEQAREQLIEVNNALYFEFENELLQYHNDHPECEILEQGDLQGDVKLDTPSTPPPPPAPDGTAT